MKPTRAVRQKAMQLLAANADTLAPATDANTMCLIKNPFTESENIAVGDLTLADFDGSTPLAVVTGAQPEGLDPVSSASIVTLKPPAGGWRWEVTGVTNLPQTIYGIALMNDDQTVVLATKRFPDSIALANAEQVINLGPQLITLAANSMS